ncbi:hypothetical protein [Gordonia phthalatica]|uniref:hypothetical protein n=1 Tax=Gordonia phthalatica TaxID=1136941 RepID=UPI0012FE9750|nr:hypothetical protein [Gordonia phthalatica]
MWPAVYPYLILATPAVVAGLVLRRRASFAALGAYAVLSALGLMNWGDEVWGALLAGVWMGASATLVTVAHWLTWLVVDGRPERDSESALTPALPH